MKKLLTISIFMLTSVTSAFAGPSLPSVYDPNNQYNGQYIGAPNSDPQGSGAKDGVLVSKDGTQQIDQVNPMNITAKTSSNEATPFTVATASNKVLIDNFNTKTIVVTVFVDTILPSGAPLFQSVPYTTINALQVDYYPPVDAQPQAELGMKSFSNIVGHFNYLDRKVLQDNSNGQSFIIAPGGRLEFSTNSFVEYYQTHGVTGHYKIVQINVI